MNFYLNILSCIILQILFLTNSHAQFTNHWVKTNQPYVKIGVKEKGIYEIPFEDLRKQGLNITPQNLDSLSLFHRGLEVAIQTTSNSIIFYGEPNDGASDSLLFRPHSSRINPHFSYFSEIGYYFLTVDKANGKRIEIYSHDDNTSLTKHIWHWKEELDVFSNQHSYSFGVNETPSLLQSYYQNGETRTGTLILGKNKYTHSYNFVNPYLSSPSIHPTIEVMVNNRSSLSNEINVKDITSNQIFHKFKLSGFIGDKYKILLPHDILKNKFSIDFSSDLTTSKFSVTYLHIKYPQYISRTEKTAQPIILPIVETQWSSFVLSNKNVASTLLAYDISDRYSMKMAATKSEHDSTRFFFERNNKNEARILLTESPLKPTSIEKVTFRNINPVSTDFIIITNHKLFDAALKYAEYRNSNTGGANKADVFDIVEIYNAFNYGEPSPVAIRNFTQFILSDKNLDKNLLLIGHSITYPNRIIKELKGVPDNNPDFSELPQIPSIGYPGSDALLVEALGENKNVNVPSIPVGRLAATIPSQVEDYLEKVKEFENSIDKGYQKNILHLSGGKTTNEISTLKNYLTQLEKSVAESHHGGNVEALSKQTLNPVDQVDISEQVNKGLGMITYFGHGSGTTTDFNMGYASYLDRSYQNKGKYPFMYFNGCGVANIFPGRYSLVPNSTFEIALSTDWVFAKNKGAIAVLANSGDSYISTSSNYLNLLYKYLFNNQENLSIGQIQLKVAKEITALAPGLYDIANLHQSFLQGDPSIKLFSQNLPDYSFDSNQGITLSSKNSQELIGEAKELKVKIALLNNGANTEKTILPLSIEVEYDEVFEVFNHTLESFANIAYFEFEIPNKGQIKSISAKVDPDNEIIEFNEQNNNTYLVVDWNTASQLQEYSQANFKDNIKPIISATVNSQQISKNQKLNSHTDVKINLTDNFPLNNNDNSLIQVYVKECSNCTYQELNTPLRFESQEHDLNINAFVNLSSLLPGNYELMIIGKDISGNNSNSLVINIELVENDFEIEITASPNPGFGYFRFNSQQNIELNISKIEYKIYNMFGSILTQYSDETPHLSSNFWTWTHNIPGVYLYKITLYTNKGPIYKSGKLINYP